MNKFNLENRLIDFAVAIIGVCEQLHSSSLYRPLSNQLIRSATSSALNYSEAIGAASHRDFIYKIRISQIELRETYTMLRIIFKIKPGKSVNSLSKILDENNQLIAILTSSAKTAERKFEKISKG